MKRLIGMFLLGATVPLLLGLGSQKAERPEIRMVSPHSYAQTIANVKEAAAKASFSVVFELDVTARAAEKNLEVPATTIIGVCSAKYAKIVMEDDLRVVPNLPCRIAVTERNGRVEVWTLDVKQLAEIYDGKRMAETATTVDGILMTIMKAAVEPAKG